MRKSLQFVLVALVVLGVAGSAIAADKAASPAPAGVVNLNTADATQISLLPRVGAKAAQRIVDYRREHGLFKKTSDLMQVKGFGEKSFERLAAWLTVDGKTTLTTKVHTSRPRGKSSKSAKKPSSPSPAAR